MLEFPTGAHQDRWMAPERPGDDLRAVDTEIHAVILNARDGGLRNTRQRGELILTQVLKFPHETNRFAHRALNRFLARRNGLLLMVYLLR